MDTRPGQLVRIKEPLETTLGLCDYGVILSEYIYQRQDPPAWRILCGDRTVILMEHEFEVIK
tara:strand:+ start:1026 stop:1211 length:186 start_codon:yes stop_codon:yes gene_type:complete